MIKLLAIPVFKPFVISSPPVLMPEIKDNVKKGNGYVVLAPSVKDELEFLSSTKSIFFRYLMRYFIDVRLELKLFGKGRTILRPNDNNAITTELESLSGRNLSNIDGVTSYLANASVRPMKDMTVLVEVNYAAEAVLSNNKDRRSIPFRANELYKAYLTALRGKFGKGNYLGNYTQYTIVPLELWLSPETIANPSKLFKNNSSELISTTIKAMIDLNNAKDFGTIVFLYKNIIMVMDTTDTAIKDSDFMEEALRQFLIKCKTAKDIDPIDNDGDVSVDDKPEDGLNKQDITPVVSGDEIIQDDRLNAKLEGKSIQSLKRDNLLKEKFTELKLGGKLITDIIANTEPKPIPPTVIHAHTINESMKILKANEFDREYNKSMAYVDLANILTHFSHVDPALYLLKDIVVEDVSTPIDRILRYTVEYEDGNRKRHRFSFLLPKMYKDKYLYLNDQSMNLLHQKLPYPVTKIAPDKCQVVTNYNKIFISRYGSNISPRITRMRKLLTSDNLPNGISVSVGDGMKLNTMYLTTVEYDELSSDILRITLGTPKNNTKIFLVVDDARAIIDDKKAPVPDNEETNEYMIPLAQHKKDSKIVNYYMSGNTNRVYNQQGIDQGELSDFIIAMMGEYNSKIAGELSSISTGTRFVYSRATIMAEQIPLVLVLGAGDPEGLQGVLRKAEIEYQFTDKKIQSSDLQASVQFSDGYLTYNRYPYENSLLLNGLSAIPTKEYSFYDMSMRETYGDIFENMYGRKNILPGIENFYYMLIDPITMDVLVKLKMPVEFTTLLLYANGTLADNTYQIDSNYANSRIRSNEIVYVHLYRYLAQAWGSYKSGRAEKFSIPEDCVIKELLTSNIVDPHSELNIVLETENDRQVKLKGPSGMNEDRSFTIEKRAYHPSMAGIIGMNSTASGAVGISRHMVLNPNILDTRGFLEIGKGDYDGTELITPGEMMNTFGAESADIERLAMSISQSKHVVPVASSVACPISHDMERVIPYISSDFAATAKEDGKVVEITDDIMIVKYKDGTYDDIDISSRPAKNTDGGFYIMNKLEPNKLKVGSSFQKNQILAYDPKHINNTDDMFGDPLAVMGTMARVAAVSVGGVYEDACVITDDLAERMATKITKQKRVIMSKFANIKYMVKVGDKVEVNDPIIAFDDTEDEFASQLMAQIAADAGDTDEIIATTAPILSKVAGVIRDIRIYYTIPLDQMTPSMRTIIKKYISSVQGREKVLNKYMGATNSNTIVKTSQQLTPDSTGKVKGVKVADGIFIDFYIEYEDIMAPGDKLNFYTALKGIVSDVIPNEYAAYTDNNPDRKIDAFISSIGVYKRMCLDFMKVGGLCKIVIEKKRMLAEKYHDRIKAKLKTMK